ncbi:recombinase family protein [Pseudolactococcus reticulitermitis]|uniref:Recombinase n=1 Tax=Pseudolactococcus reticulitermitis TaxID=2025039 RepID=A0A224X139_9LACT|nr:recombinase family protein [Lactococcus reticulitermitis]GAX47917.1 hypothetical protein RsY01_1521 [Lactococcus reticulitermitis]
MVNQITKIPATRHPHTSRSITHHRKKKVAAYARVSTDNEDQVTSYEAQIDYYTTYIKGRTDWDFAGMYADEGITATNTTKRVSFKQMITDALAGKIDLIVTKSVSRFARNTVDSLTTVRQLKESGIEIYFEKENIWTFDSKGELLITIMSSFAQEESRSISENCTWGQRKRFADGKVTVPFGQFLGYDRGEDGNLVLNKAQAVIIRKIFGLFFKGLSLYGIAKQLSKEKILTPGGKAIWNANTVRRILTNEKYKGDALLQKSYTVDFLTKKKKVNEGEIPQYYVQGNHEAIISSEVFDAVQRQLAIRRKDNGHYSRASVFSSKLKCGDCASWYGSKVWHSTDKYRRVIWQCNHKFSGKEKCQTPHFDEAEIKQIFINAVNKLFSDKRDIIENFNVIKAELFSTEELEKKQKNLEDEAMVIGDMIQEAISENTRVALNQEDYERQYNHLVEKFELVSMRQNKIKEELIEKKVHKNQVEKFLKALENLDLITKFDEDLWCSLLEHITIYDKGQIIRFKDGTEIRE